MTDDVNPPEIILVGGVSGSGKTTVGTLLAERLGWDYAEADDFHSPENIAKMRAGTPLTDADRMPWLRSIGEWMDGRVRAGKPGIVTCSALKRAYRDVLVEGRPGVVLVLLDGDRDLIAARMRERKGHFFKAELLDSQFADYEPPAPDEESTIAVPVTGTPEEIADRILAAVGR